MLALTREKIVGLLQKVPGLADSYAKRDPGYVNLVVDWLTEIEENLAQLRHPLTSLAAAQRAAILAAHDGLRDPLIEAGSKRKAIRASAALTIGRTEEALRAALDAVDEQLSEAREKLVQLLAVATADNPILGPTDEPRSVWLERVWRALDTNAGTQSMYSYLAASLSTSDRVYLLSEVTGNLLARDSGQERGTQDRSTKARVNRRPRQGSS